ncbi:MAG: HlyD family secretion protein [Chitinophagales bacterium]|nr:HlyD family secretion protein [Chitinophagales bacterium]
MENNTSKEQQPKKISKRFIIALILIISIGGTFGVYKYLYSLSHVSTDNAQIAADVYYVIPHVGGYVQTVHVTDNQIVKKGDTLLVIDDDEYALKVSEAQAALEIAKSNLEVTRQNLNLSETQVSTADASIAGAETSIEAAEIRVWRAESDFKRYEDLYQKNVITKQQYEQALAEKQAAEKQLDVIKQQKVVADKQKGSTASQTKVALSQIKVAEANVAQHEVVLKEALLNLSYCVITAPVDGQISTVGITSGQLLKAGQSLFNIVLMKSLWITANFKETQMTDMKVGQKVKIEIDAYPKDNFEGTVTSLSPATGALFSILPPDNATGNFVKIVQRVPVRIDFTESENLDKLRPGLSADVTVTTK